MKANGETIRYYLLKKVIKKKKIAKKTKQVYIYFSQIEMLQQFILILKYQKYICILLFHEFQK